VNVKSGAVLQFIKDHFPIKDYKIKGDHVQLNSIFKTDSKFHMGITIKPKYGYPVGTFNCWKSGESGNFLKFVMCVKSCDLGVARNCIRKYNMMSPDDNDNESNLYTQAVDTNKGIEFPTGISCMIHKQSYAYLKDRGIRDEDIMLHNMYYVEDDSKKFASVNHRLLIPTLEDGCMVSFAARTITDDDDNSRYMAASNRSHCVFNLDNVDHNMIMIVEGAIDAIKCSGVAINGQQLSETQLHKILNKHPKSIAVMLDLLNSDRSPNQFYKNNTTKILGSFLRHGFTNLFILDPSGTYSFKDAGELDYESAYNLRNCLVPLNVITKVKLKLN
jgi:hypothetical protein